MTLLEEAKKIREEMFRKYHNVYTSEDVELLMAYIRGEISSVQIGRVKGYKTTNKWNASSLYCYFWGVLKYGLANNLIEIKEK